MASSFPREPYDIQFAPLALTLFDMLARDMDVTFCALIHRVGRWNILELHAPQPAKSGPNLTQNCGTSLLPSRNPV
jgi:hypothetical protein